MRLPLLATLVLLIVNLAIDRYIWCRLRNTRPSSAWLKAQTVSAILFNLALVAVICMPKRRGGDTSLDILMWVLYAYFSVYVPKAIYAIFSLLASLPRLWHGSRIRFVSHIGLFIGVAVFATMWWGALINRYSLDVNRIEIEIEGLPDSFDGYTIVQISDLHTGTFGSDTSFVADVVQAVNPLHPDLIAFTGDIVNRRTSELEPFAAILSTLSATDGVMSVLGNHDYGDYYVWPDEHAKRNNLLRLCDMQASMGWTLLNNATATVKRGCDSIAVIGVENVGDPPFHTYGDLDAAYSGDLCDPTVKILLSHNPAHWNDDIRDSPDKNIALTLSGHTHAMQISLFGHSPAAWRYPTWGGLYSDEDRHKLYVNIGLGEVAIPARIGATPEITYITLKKAGAPTNDR